MHTTHSYTYTNTTYTYTYCRRRGLPASHLPRPKLQPVPQVYCSGAIYCLLAMCDMCFLFYT